MDPATLDGRAGHGGLDGLPEAEVGGGDDQLHPAQPAGLERPQERRPEGTVLRVANGEAEDLAAPSPHTPVAITTAWATTRRLIRALQ